MNLQLANDAVTELQRTLGLHPDSIPKTEFAVEAFIIYTSFNGDCVRISPAENDTFESVAHRPDNIPPDTYQAPCVSVICQEDDSIDGPGDVLCFTYYDGDNIPTGPHHALVVTNLTTKALLYWRQRSQNPLSKWAHNIYAHCQFDFKFNLDGSDPRYMTQKIFYELMHDHKATDFLKIDASTKFLAEVACLNLWNAEHNGAPNEEGIDFDPEFDSDSNQLTILISCNNRPDIEQLLFVYDIERESGRHALKIYEKLSDEDWNTLYERENDQDEAIDWLQNYMAGDSLVTDENGDPLFQGEPVRE